MSICKYCGKPIMRGEVWNLDENGNGYHHACLIEIEFDENQKRVQRLAQKSILDKIRAEIAMYEADCRLQGGTDECEKCNSNVFGSIYRIIDKYKVKIESEE